MTILIIISCYGISDEGVKYFAEESKSLGSLQSVSLDLRE